MTPYIKRRMSSGRCGDYGDTGQEGSPRCTPRISSSDCGSIDNQAAEAAAAVKSEATERMIEINRQEGRDRGY